MKLRFCLKKEWAHFSRTFRFAGVIIAAFAVVIVYPMLFKFTGVLMKELSEQVLSISMGSSGQDFFGGMTFGDMAEMYFDAGLMYSTTMASVFSITLLVFMLILCSAAGGEQKKRAMIIPLCSGLSTKHYVLAKFILYPLVCFADVFLSSMLCGALCNALFPNNTINAGLLVLSSALAGVYIVFAVCVFISLGICTSKPGVMAAVVFVVITITQTVLQMVEQNFGSIKYNPFSLVNLVSGEMLASPDFSLADNTLNIALSVIISLAVSVIMSLLAIAVLNAKKINNREEKKPEF